MEELDLTGVERVLAVVAHPDDIDFGWAGSVAVMTDAGIDVVYCLVTDGDAAGPRPARPARRWRRCAATSSAPRRRSSACTTCTSSATPTAGSRRRSSCAATSAASFAPCAPNRVITQSPDRSWDRIYASHPDHLAAGEAAVCAVYPDARNRWAHPELADEGLEPWTVDALWLGIGRDGATHYVDITTAVDRKIDALLSHKSQLPDPDATETMVRSWTGAIAQAAGLPEGRAAEAMRVVNTR